MWNQGRYTDERYPEQGMRLARKIGATLTVLPMSGKIGLAAKSLPALLRPLLVQNFKWNHTWRRQLKNLYAGLTRIPTCICRGRWIGSMSPHMANILWIRSSKLHWTRCVSLGSRPIPYFRFGSRSILRALSKRQATIYGLKGSNPFKGTMLSSLIWMAFDYSRVSVTRTCR